MLKVVYLSYTKIGVMKFNNQGYNYAVHTCIPKTAAEMVSDLATMSEASVIYIQMWKVTKSIWSQIVIQ